MLGWHCITKKTTGTRTNTARNVRLQEHEACRQWERKCRQRVGTCGRQKECELCRDTTEEVGDSNCSTSCVSQLFYLNKIQNAKQQRNVNRVHQHINRRSNNSKQAHINGNRWLTMRNGNKRGTNPKQQSLWATMKKRLGTYTQNKQTNKETNMICRQSKQKRSAPTPNQELL